MPWSEKAKLGALHRLDMPSFSLTFYIVAANHGHFPRGVAVSSLVRTLSEMGYVPVSEEIALQKAVAMTRDKVSEH